MDEEAFSEETVALEVDFGAERVLHLAYWPHRAKLKDNFDPPDTPEGVAALVLRLVARWDLHRGGQPVPLTQEALIETNGRLLQMVIEAIGEDLRPGEATGSSSSAISSGTGS